MTRYDIAKFYGYNSPEEYDEAQRRLHENFVESKERQKPYDEKEPVKIQPVKQWVKLHDKHPNTEGFYLVCDQYGECEVVEYLPDIKSWFTHKIKGEIQYWAPLPEVPKDGGAE